MATVVCAQNGSFGAENPFSPPTATVHYAPDRTYHLQHLRLDFDVDYAQRLLQATATNTVVALVDGTTKLRFHAGASTKIESVQIDGQSALFTRDSEGILVDCAPSVAGKRSVVKIQYHLKKSETPGGRGVGGWHWHEPSKADPAKIGFYTNGETEDTRDWAVTWDYPNDFTTTETHTTVPMDWQVIGNGLQVSDEPTADGKRHTVTWRLDEPHATYLTSVVAGPFDIHHDRWRGIPLLYVAPKGMGGKLDYSFSHTKDILSFYSDKLGVKYPWPKYAQDITYDFGGGQENVSATTYGTFLTDPREDDHGMDWLIAHETGHQWFGDYVTCKDWGQIWLNESFATFMEMTYTEHSRGTNASLREIEQNSQEYFFESKRYKRALATNLYSNPGVMFDQHTYPKGGVLLMSLRRLLGDKPLYAGLHRYLTTHHNSPVESNDLCEALTEATGTNLHPWFDQWVLKPGHPVIDWSWKWDADHKQVVVHVNQIQDLKNGTPIYDVPTHVGLLWVKNSSPLMVATHLNAVSQDFRIAATGKPDSVVFDPEHEFLREIPRQPWQADEYPAILAADPNPVDRSLAFEKILDAKPSSDQVQWIVGVLKKDTGANPAIVNTEKLATFSDPSLVGFWQSELKSPNYRRRVVAVQAIGKFAKEPAIKAQLTALINDTQPYDVVDNALTTLEAVDPISVQPILFKLAKDSSSVQLQLHGLNSLAKLGTPAAVNVIFDMATTGKTDLVQSLAIQALAEWTGEDPRLKPLLHEALKADSFELITAAENVIVMKKLKEFISELESVAKNQPGMARQIKRNIDRLNGVATKPKQK